MALPVHLQSLLQVAEPTAHMQVRITGSDRGTWVVLGSRDLREENQ